MTPAEALEGRCIKYELVGSRVTCNPAPVDTDQDVLVLTDESKWAEYLGPMLVTEGFEKGGSDCGNVAGYMAQTPLSFQSFTLGELNLIVTFDPEFYRRFMAATAIAKHLNLLVKTDRVMLFQGVLYGNGPFVEQPAIPFDLLPAVPNVEAYWVCLQGIGSRCVEAFSSEAAATIASALTSEEVLSVERLPYPASPRLNPYEHPSHGVCPSFCYAPAQCKGRTSCPQRISCTE